MCFNTRICSIISLIMSIYIYFNNGDSDLVSYYHDIQGFLSYLGEIPYHCIDSLLSYILEKPYQCINHNENYDKPYQCIYDESYFTQNILFLKSSNKHTGEKISTSLGLLAVHTGRLGRKAIHSKSVHSKNLYALKTLKIYIILHTGNMLTQEYILYSIGRSMFTTHHEYVR